MNFVNWWCNLLISNTLTQTQTRSTVMDVLYQLYLDTALTCLSLKIAHISQLWQTLF